MLSVFSSTQNPRDVQGFCAERRDRTKNDAVRTKEGFANNSRSLIIIFSFFLFDRHPRVRIAGAPRIQWRPATWPLRRPMGRRPNPRLQSPRLRCESWKCNRKKWTYFSGTKSTAHTTGKGRSHHSEVFVEQKTYSFLYQDGDTVVLMEPNTFEQEEVSRELFGNAAVYLKEDIPITLHMYDERIMSASIPPKVTCTVVDAPPTHKGLTAVPQYKKVLLDNGLTVSVPPFIKAGDQIVVNTIEDTYVTRAK